MLEKTQELATPRKMGRPPIDKLGHARTTVRLTKRTGERIDAVMGREHRRSIFIRAAIERELQRLEAEGKKGGAKRK